MKPDYEVRRALDTADLVRFEGDKLTPADVDWDRVDDMDEAVTLWRFAQTQLVAARQVSKVASEQLASLLGEGGAYGYGDSVVRFKKKRTERCIDPERFIRYLTMQVKSDFVDLADVVNPSYAKRSWMDQAVRDTFYEWVDGEPGLTVTPIDRVPKWLQGINDGEIVQGKHE